MMRPAGGASWRPLALCLLVAVAPLASAQERVVIFVAASVGPAMTDVAAAYADATVVVSAGSTATLAQQIAAGAPADLFLAADAAWMDHLEHQGLIDRAQRADLLANRLVFISRRDHPVTVTLPGPLPTFDGRLALANPDSVPAGRYAQAALTRLGWWEALHDRVAPAADVRAALRLVERGEADLGVVYATDAHQNDRIHVAATVPESLHPPIRYPLALTTTAQAAAPAVLAFLRGPVARALFERHGFAVLTP